MNTWIKETEYQKQKEFSESKPNWSPRENHNGQRRSYWFVEPTQYEVQCGTARTKDESHRYGNDLHYRSQYAKYEHVLCSRARLSADHRTRNIYKRKERNKSFNGENSPYKMTTSSTRHIQSRRGTYQELCDGPTGNVERNRTGQSNE